MVATKAIKNYHFQHEIITQGIVLLAVNLMIGVDSTDDQNTMRSSYLRLHLHINDQATLASKKKFETILSSLLY